MCDLKKYSVPVLFSVFLGCVTPCDSQAEEGKEVKARGHGPAPFSVFDMDGNGFVSEEEFNSVRQQRMAARASEGKKMRCAASAPAFADLDIDGDGQLSPDELTAGQKAHRSKCREQMQGHGRVTDRVVDVAQRGRGVALRILL